jgi:cytidylate kinase
MKSDKGWIIAIDGPSGAGKSAVAKEVAQRLGYLYIDTGAMYRAVGLKALRQELDLNDEQAVSAMAEGAQIELQNQAGRLQVLLDGEDVTDAIRVEAVSRAASLVSRHSGVRRRMVSLQHAMGRHGKVVMEGRDIGTKVFPHADLKIFLDASDETRGLRRYKENQLRGGSLSLDETLAEIRSRDERDSQRENSPLVQAHDAVCLDSSNKTLDEVLDAVMEMVKKLRVES